MKPVLAMVLGGAAALASAAPLKLHVPSPDWRDQVIYFVMTDRFANGNPRNDDQGAGEFRPGERAYWQGGDLPGLTQRLDYIRGLGATAVWITPPVANQWINGSVGYTGYHGYWAEHFMRVDAHYGTLADYRRLSHELHTRGMYLVQDIVLNHIGDFFHYRPGAWKDGDPAAGWEANPKSVPARPSQAPLGRNDPRKPGDRRAGLYHWTPDITDYTDARQERFFQMSGLDDLASDNPAVQRLLRESYGFWIREVGVDAFRVDTVFYVPPETMPGFLHAKDPKAPGVAEVARRTGRRDFLVFGEGFGIDRPFDDTQARKIEGYMHAPDGSPRLPGMLNFPLYGAFGDAFARGRPTAQLAHRIRQTMALHPRAHWMPTFVDNHDVDRFLAGGSMPALRQALLAMFTLPGIPVVYYGTEQGFTEVRASMFAGGWGSGGRDHYDTAAPLYRDIAALAALRRGERALTRGTPVLLAENAAGPGAVAWRMAHEGRTLVVALNTAERPVLVDGLDTGAGAPRRLRPLLALGETGFVRDSGPVLTADASGIAHAELPPRGAVVWVVEPAADAGASSAASGGAPLVDPLPGAAVRGDFAVTGRAAPGQVLRIVTDGDLARATTATAGADGRWQATVDTAPFADATLTHRVVAWDAANGRASAPQRFRVERDWRPAAETADPAGDDDGPPGHPRRYAYPTDPTYAPRQMDLRGVRAHTAGGALRLEIATAAVTTSWNPANGFDHVAFSVFVELPGEPGGVQAMPQQDATLPDGMRWHRRLRVHGWSNALFSHEGASATQDGTPIVPGAALAVDRTAHTVTLTLPAAALGSRRSLEGARVYVTTWDYDGGFRGFADAPHRTLPSGGRPGDPKLMDAAGPLRLAAP